uniref:Septin-type G domain-containing protein n=1 Tax=Capra hircus TaxID=9925 RepID=A0A8C2NDD5_CAPHI
RRNCGETGTSRHLGKGEEATLDLPPTPQPLYGQPSWEGHGACAEAETGEAEAAPAHLGAGGRGGEESVGKEAGRRDDSIRPRARRGGAGRERAAGAGRVCRAVDWSQFFGEAAQQPAQFINPETPGYVGFANLPNQVHRKSVKKGFEFTLMVVGESGLGKSTLINSLFLTDLYPERVIPGAAGCDSSCLYYVFDEDQVKMVAHEKTCIQRKFLWAWVSSDP